MTKRTILVGLVMAVGAAVAWTARADKPAAPAAGASPAAGAAPAAATCKAYNGKACCDPAVAAHLSKEAVFKACGESTATFLGEQGSKETCKYVFKVEGQKEDDTFVQVYAPVQKEVMAQPNDPFFKWKKVGKAYITDKASSPKSAPMMLIATGLYFPGKGYSVSVNASTKVCTKEEAKKLASELK